MYVFYTVFNNTFCSFSSQSIVVLQHYDIFIICRLSSVRNMQVTKRCEVELKPQSVTNRNSYAVVRLAQKSMTLSVLERLEAVSTKHGLAIPWIRV